MTKQDYAVPSGFEERILSHGQMYLGTVPLGLLCAAVGLTFVWLYGKPQFLQGNDIIFSWYVFLPVLIIGIVAHELLHAFTWKVASGLGWNTMKFGILWQYLAPFAHCTEPMNVRSYIIGGAMPGIVLGIIPLFASLLFADSALFWFGTIFTTAATGDLGIIWLLRSLEANTLVQDHPQKPGCLVQSSPQT